MRRKIEDKLLEWKEKNATQTALFLNGARRVGKSYVVEEFAKKHYKSYIMIDFNIASEDVKALFYSSLDDLDQFFMFLSSYYNVKLFERDTLIIFDEIQLFPKARSAIKYLVADGRYDYIETGSLVSIRKNTQNIMIPSEERQINLYPMDLEEFAWALEGESILDAVRFCFQKKQPMGQALHRKAMNLFRQYLIVGGMPQAVASYAEKRDFEQVDAIKRDILSLYRNDMAKHAAGYEAKVVNIFDEIPAQLQRHERKFSFASISKAARFREYEDALFWLNDAMIINTAYNTTAPNIGLRLNMDRMTLKCYMADTGLLISHAFDENSIVSEELYKKLLFDKLEVNLGMILENMVAQMLAVSCHRLYFYSNSSRDNKEDRMEIDFLISKKTITSRHNISPIEVKSSKNYTLTSLRKFIKKYDQQLETPFVVHCDDFAIKDGIIYLPVYMVPLL